jgi:hypothetical protein
MLRLRASDTIESQVQNPSNELEAARDFSTHPDFAEARADSLLWDVASLDGLAMLQAETFFAERSARADMAAFDKLMRRKSGEPPRVGDEIAGDLPPL